MLQKLDIRPFTYGLMIDCVYDNGSVFDAAVLDLTDADMGNKFAAACSNVATVSLELGFPTLASLPHSIANAFRALVGVVIEGCDTYSFAQADAIKVRYKTCSMYKVLVPCVFVTKEMVIPTLIVPSLPTRSRLCFFCIFFREENDDV